MFIALRLDVRHKNDEQGNVGYTDDDRCIFERLLFSFCQTNSCVVDEEIASVWSIYRDSESEQNSEITVVKVESDGQLASRHSQPIAVDNFIVLYLILLGCIFKDLDDVRVRLHPDSFNAIFVYSFVKKWLRKLQNFLNESFWPDYLIIVVDNIEWDFVSISKNIEVLGPLAIQMVTFNVWNISIQILCYKLFLSQFRPVRTTLFFADHAVKHFSLQDADRDLFVELWKLE